MSLLKKGVCIGLITALFPLVLLITEAVLPQYYADSYYAELAPMYERLRHAKEKKIVIVGGSNIAFGLDGALLEQLLSAHGYDYTVCPFGLYAAVGTSVMLELSKACLKEGDIVILAIEPVSETFSSYFGASAFFKCAEQTPELLFHVNQEQKAALAGSYISYLQERCEILFHGSVPQAEGVYARESFDERCDMIYERQGNTMPLGFDTGTPVDFRTVTIAPEFAGQVNDYCETAAKKGAAVYFSFSPVNYSALADSSAESVYRYFQLCSETFLCPIISDPNDYILESGWFYDSNFHLNSAGAQVRTFLLAEDILNQFGYYGKVDYSLPQMPDSVARMEQEAEGMAGEQFLFSAIFNSKEEIIGYLVSGLTEIGRRQEALRVPASYNGLPVVGFTADALETAQELLELTLPETVESIPDGLFCKAAKLTRLVFLHRERQCTIGEEPFAGAEQLRIYVPEESYFMYRDGYGCETNPWADYLDRIFIYD